jgi:signal transduction histidine kinase
MQILTSLKFKLTLWYSSFMLVFCLMFIVLANILLTNQIRNEPTDPPTIFGENRPIMQKWEELDEERRELIQEYREQDLEDFRRLSVFMLLPLTGLSFLGGYLIAEHSLNPLKKLNKQIREINSENLSIQIDHDDNGDEISELIKNFNTMTSRLDSSFQAQRQFIEDASHELKTPLAIIQTNLDAAKLDKKITKSEASGLIETAQRSGEFMNKLIEDLLLLAVLENNIDLRKSDIAGIIGDAISSIQTVAKEKNISVKLSKPKKKIESKVNETLLQRAISNLIENAVKYSPKQTETRIRLTEKEGNIEIQISDQGPGIAKKEQKKIFERFYRVDKSRSRKTGGTGLGLSIVKKIIEAHNGQIAVQSSKKKGTSFIITLPTR